MMAGSCIEAAKRKSNMNKKGSVYSENCVLWPQALFHACVLTSTLTFSLFLESETKEAKWQLIYLQKCQLKD
jgi:hypothetical protein